MRRTLRLSVLVALLLVLLPFVLRLRLIPTRGFNPDELEHMHFAWCISKGMVPYRDYFEHHTPWLHYMLQPIFHLYHVDTQPDDASAAFAAGRQAIWVWAGLTLVLTYALARRTAGTAAAAVGIVLLSNAAVFLNKSLEIRPDIPASALLVLGVLLCGRGLERPRARLALLAAGVCLGAAAMFTQKVLFVGPGLALASAALVCDPRSGTPRAARLRAWLLVAAGAALPAVLTWIYFARHGAAQIFLRYNFLLNARWPGLGPREFVLDTLRQDPLLCVLGLAGCVCAVGAWIRRPGARALQLISALSGVALVVALAYHPAVTFHYLLLPLPFLACHAGEMIAFLGRRLVQAIERASPARRSVLLLASGLACAAAPVAAIALTPLGAAAWRALTATALVAMLSVCWLLARRLEQAALAVFLIAASAMPLLRLEASFRRGNWATIQGIRYVLRNSAPWEPCLDGFSGLGVFRPSAFFHAFQNRHTLAIQTPLEHRELLGALETGRVVPKLVFWDLDLQEGTPPAVKAYLERHYVPVGLEPIRVRPFDNDLGFWNDEGTRFFGWVRGQERAPHMLFDDRWRVPSFEDGAAVRRTRTDRSAFIVPIRRRARYRLSLHAKADPTPAAAAFAVLVNRRQIAGWDALPRWHDYECELEPSDVIPGFNAFELRTGDVELALATLTLTRLDGAPRPPPLSR